MNRRNFIKLLGAIPFIPLASKVTEAKTDSGFFQGINMGLEESANRLLSQTEEITEKLAAVYSTPYPENKVVSWNGEQWSNLEFGAEGKIYVKGDFLLDR